MARFTLAQLFNAILLTAIVLAFLFSDGCGDPRPSIRTIEFSPDSLRLAVSRFDTTTSGNTWPVFSWSVTRGRITRLARTDSVLDVSSLAVEKILDQKVLRGDVASLAFRRFRGSHLLAYFGDSHTLAVVSLDGDLSVLDTDTMARRPMALGIPLVDSINSLRASREVLAIGGNRGTCIFNATTGRSTLLQCDKSYGGFTDAIGVTPDSKRVIAAVHWDAAVLFDTVAGKQLASLTLTDEGITGVAISPDGMIAVTSEQWARLYDSSFNELAPLADGDSVEDVQFSPDGAHVAVAIDGRVDVFRVSTRELAYSVPVGDRALSVAYSPDGDYLAAGGETNVMLCEAGTGRVLKSADAPGYARPQWPWSAALFVMWLAWMLTRKRVSGRKVVPFLFT